MVTGGFGPWRAAIGKVEALKPRHIVAGHQNSAALRRRRADDQRRPGSTSTTPTNSCWPRQPLLGFFNAAIGRYPDHLARTVLWAGASALYGVREHPGQDAEHVAQILVAGWL